MKITSTRDLAHLKKSLKNVSQCAYFRGFAVLYLNCYVDLIFNQYLVLENL